MPIVTVFEAKVLKLKGSCPTIEIVETGTDPGFLGRDGAAELKAS
jgi:hypothetical protein